MKCLVPPSPDGQVNAMVAASNNANLHDAAREQQSLTGKLAIAIAEKSIGGDDLQAACLFTLDAVANFIAGRNSLQGRKLLAWLSYLQSGHNTNVDEARLSFFYGALSHILEVDDLHRASVVHPGCVVVPAVLATGAGMPGHEVLSAVIRGFEACCRVGMCVGSEHYKIWHNTATCGPFGSAMAGASLLKLDYRQTVHALGNAGSQSSGLWEFLDTGAETKHLHAGRGAEAGVVAAGLALQGFTGAPHILEGERGFFKATCPNANPALLLPSAEEPWQLHLTSIKPWPSCRHTHPAIECGLALNKQIERVENVKAITVTAYGAALDLCDRLQTDSAYAGKFSLQHCVSAALSDGIVDFGSFDTAARDRLASLRHKVTVCAAEPYASSYPRHWGSRVEVVLVDGRELSHEVSDARGDPELPLSRQDMIEKAAGLMRHGGIEDPDELIQQVLSLADDAPLPDFSAYLAV